MDNESESWSHDWKQVKKEKKKCVFDGPDCHESEVKIFKIFRRHRFQCKNCNVVICKACKDSKEILRKRSCYFHIFNTEVTDDVLCQVCFSYKNEKIFQCSPEVETPDKS